ncbi:MAG: toprim domain-containing protein [Pseudolabrys sp.]|nr:toprim domain-containing protein [Pseudolabrys sp.]MDP2298312.1 toprim domain-containing protein [Pseudolabrys sp.]
MNWLLRWIADRGGVAKNPMTFMKTKDAARGRWRSILPTLGVPASLLNGKHQPCPRCGGKDRFRFTDYQCSGGFICNQCGNGSGIDLLMMWRGWDFKTAAREVDRIVVSAPLEVPRTQRTDQQNRTARERLWQLATPVTPTDPAGRYLGMRCGVTNYSGALRFISSLHCSGERNNFPAMLAMLTAPDGGSCQIHRTYLTATGSKAPIESPRRMMAGLVAKGAAVRLTEAATVLGIAEGIETALSATALHGIPCWAALNADMLKNWQPPKMVTRVVIFADNDEDFAGQEAGFALARRMKAEARAADVRFPDSPGEDWNDVHRALMRSVEWQSANLRRINNNILGSP